VSPMLERGGHQPRGADIRHVAAGCDFRRRAIGLALREASGSPALQVDGTIIRRVQPRETSKFGCDRGRASWCDSTPSATGAAAASSSACSTYPSYLMRCATSSQ
jgi:hypothetical protein